MSLIIHLVTRSARCASTRVANLVRMHRRIERETRRTFQTRPVRITVVANERQLSRAAFKNNFHPDARIAHLSYIMYGYRTYIKRDLLRVTIFLQ